MLGRKMPILRRIGRPQLLIDAGFINLRSLQLRILSQLRSRGLGIFQLGGSLRLNVNRVVAVNDFQAAWEKPADCLEIRLRMS